MSIRLVTFWLCLCSMSFLTCATAGNSIDGEMPVTAIEVLSANSILVGGDDGIYVCDSKTLKRTRKINSNLEKVHAIKVSPDRNWVAVAGGTPAESGIVQVYQLPEITLKVSFAWGEDVATDVAWQSNSRLVSCGMRGDCCFLKFAAEEKSEIVKVHSKPTFAVEVVDDALAISAGADGVIKSWQDPKQVVRNLNNHTAAINALALRPSSATGEQPMVASASDDSTVRFWQPKIGRMVRFVRLKSKPTCLTWSRDGSFVIAGCQDGSLRLIDVNQAKTIKVLTAGSWINCVAFSEDDMHIFSGTGIGLIKVEIPENIR